MFFEPSYLGHFLCVFVYKSTILGHVCVHPILWASMTGSGSQGCHVLSGGTGALGLVFAAWMAEHGARLGEDDMTLPRVGLNEIDLRWLLLNQVSYLPKVDETGTITWDAFTHLDDFDDTLFELEDDLSATCRHLALMSRSGRVTDESLNGLFEKVRKVLRQVVGVATFGCCKSFPVDLGWLRGMTFLELTWCHVHFEATESTDLATEETSAVQVQKLAEVSVLKGDIAKQQDVLSVMQEARWCLVDVGNTSTVIDHSNSRTLQRSFNFFDASNSSCSSKEDLRIKCSRSKTPPIKKKKDSEQNW